MIPYVPNQEDTDDPTLDNLVVSFRDGCVGVGLFKRGENDPHICFIPLSEDDGYWFPSIRGASSYWMPLLMGCYQAAFNWMQENAVRESEYGWRFKV